MSKNPGNTGQRWTMSTVASVEARGDHVHTVLQCGHEYDWLPMWGTAAESAARSQERIGKRTACSRCSKAVSR